jgi:hypothetical protein
VRWFLFCTAVSPQKLCFFQHGDGSPSVIEDRSQEGAFNIGSRRPRTRPNISADMNATARDFEMVCEVPWRVDPMKGMLIQIDIRASAGLQRAQQTAAPPFQPFLTYPPHPLSSISLLLCCSSLLWVVGL